MDEGMEERSLADAFDLLEDGNTPIKLMRITNEGVSISIVTADLEDSPLLFCDESLDVDEWRRLGRVVKETSIEIFELRGRLGGGEVIEAAARCIGSFFNEVKHNTSIGEADLDLNLVGLSMDDVSQFISNNTALKRLSFACWAREPVLLEQITVLSQAISSVQLERLDIGDECYFENDGSLEQMLAGCAKVYSLRLVCNYSSHDIALAELLRNPSSVLTDLYVDVWSYHTVREITTSLVGNTKLVKLTLHIHGWFELDGFDIDNLLCNTSSIGTISSSNHTLQTIDVLGHELSMLAKQCLELNKNVDKEKVIHDKIRRFYFVGDFDVSSLVNTPQSVLPEIMDKIEGDGKQSAIYRLLKCIPELCNVADRNSSGSPGNKRQKMV